MNDSSSLENPTEFRFGAVHFLLVYRNTFTRHETANEIRGNKRIFVGKTQDQHERPATVLLGNVGKVPFLHGDKVWL